MTDQRRLCQQEWHDTPCYWDDCQACQEECPEPTDPTGDEEVAGGVPMNPGQRPEPNPGAEACLDYRRGDCRGPVEYHATPGRIKGFPRCDKHWQERLDLFYGSIEEEALSPSPPAWFDPAYAGERWDEDY